MTHNQILGDKKISLPDTSLEIENNQLRAPAPSHPTSFPYFGYLPATFCVLMKLIHMSQLVWGYDKTIRGGGAEHFPSQ